MNKGMLIITEVLELETTDKVEIIDITGILTLLLLKVV